MAKQQRQQLNKRHSPRQHRSRRLPLLFPVLLLVVLAAGGGYLVFRDTVPPAILLTPDQEIVNLGVTFELHVLDTQSGLERIEVTLTQDGRVKQHLEKVFPSETASHTEIFHLDKDKYSDGPFEVRVTADDASLYPFGHGGESDLVRTYTLDATKPTIETGGGLHYLDQGGASIIRFKANEPLSRAGIAAGGRFFPAYRQPDGSWLCLFAMPWDTPPQDYKPHITATDRAGNENTHSVRVHSDPTPYRKDTLRLPDSFLQAKMDLFRQVYPGSTESDPLTMYLALNNDLRKKNAEELGRIGMMTSPQPLWEGAFLRAQGTRTAKFGDQRDYVYQGKVVDHQTHMGVDLADKSESPIMAANRGKVAFAGFLGIYGNAVVVDHGLGLQTLYAHLSSITVTQGQEVAKGEQVGFSGLTGLAGGDHLHFGILISGTPVEPKEWWDGAWIKNNIDTHLE